MLQEILDNNKVSEDYLINTVATLQHKKDYSDIFFEYTTYESFVLDDNIIKDIATGVTHGVGLRANYMDKTHFAYSDTLDKKAIDSAAEFVTSTNNKYNSNQSFVKAKNQNLYSPATPILSITNEEKVCILKDINKIARSNSFVVQVSASLQANHQEVLIINSDHKIIDDYRPLVRLNVTITASKNGITEQASSGGGGRYSYSYFLNNGLYKEYVQDALRQVMIKLDATSAPAGTMPVVLGSGWPGVLLHEAIGHGLESDFNRKKTSCFSDKIGQKIASEKCTIVDNGTINNRRGSLNVDDEGTPTTYNTLVAQGVLQNYMFDKLNARLMQTNSTGNGRRESYAHIPMPRMTNTYMLSGTDKLADMIASTANGIYALNFSGGQVDITSGEFVFSVSEGYLIENGKVTKPIKEATLIGKGAEVLQQISMVSDDLALDSGVGTCGKDGQSVPVGVGQPSLKVDKLVVGGTKI